MDPDTALADLRAGVAAVRDAADGNGDLITSAEILADAAAALDEWITRGGFLPAEWRQA